MSDVGRVGMGVWPCDPDKLYLSFSLSGVGFVRFDVKYYSPGDPGRTWWELFCPFRLVVFGMRSLTEV
jgi:hypothetical protein